MIEKVMKVANEPGVWAIAIIIVLIVLSQVILYIRLAFNAAHRIQLPREKCIHGLRSGIIGAIGPCFAILIIMVGMVAIVGAPISWLRLSVIGAAPTELTAATVGSEAYGVEFGSPDYDLGALATSWWTMAINGIGWLIIVGLITHKLEDLRTRLGGGDPKWLAIISGAAMLGAFSFLNAKSILAGGGKLIAAVTAGISMVILLKIAQKKILWLREYTLGISMLIGITFAVMFT